jgi:hypothetical protein
MHILRTSQLIARLVLVWFALFVGAATASSFIQSDGLQMVCATGGGIKWVNAEDDGGSDTVSAGMDCPLCATVTPPPTLSNLQFQPPSPWVHALQPTVVVRIAAATAPPLPSRGPPSSFH